MNQTKTPSLDTLCTFFDPHPGLAGAMIPIPAAIKRIADELNGQTLTLSEAITRLHAVGIGTISVVADYNYIGLSLKGRGGIEHFFRVIRFSL